MPDANANWSPDPERLAALAEFAAGAGHEINNPLASIVGRAQLLLRDETDPQRRDALATIIAQAFRVRDMIGDVMLLARPPLPRRQSFNLSRLVATVVDRFAREIESARATVTSEIPAACTILADESQVTIVLAELIRNGLEALPAAGGQITLAARETDNSVELSISDSGRGFDEQERRHAFDPFFSGRQAGRGLGFGLCKVWSIVRNHGGEIDIESVEAVPTTVRIRWPVP